MESLEVILDEHIFIIICFLPKITLTALLQNPYSKGTDLDMGSGERV